MTKSKRARYTLEFKQEAVRLVEGGLSIAPPIHYVRWLARPPGHPSPVQARVIHLF